MINQICQSSRLSLNICIHTKVTQVNLGYSITLQDSSFPTHSHMSVWIGIDDHSFMHFYLLSDVVHKAESVTFERNSLQQQTRDLQRTLVDKDEEQKHLRQCYESYCCEVTSQKHTIKDLQLKVEEVYHFSLPSLYSVVWLWKLWIYDWLSTQFSDFLIKCMLLNFWFSTCKTGGNAEYQLNNFRKIIWNKC